MEEKTVVSMSTKEYYETNGYVIYRNLIPRELIDKILNLYTQSILPSNYPFFRQNTNKYEPNEITEHGYVKQAFLDIHDYQKQQEFSTTAKEIFCSQQIQDALKEVTGSSSFNLMQTMLFDANAETPPHQDWWYLDSVPNGNLIAAWIALEDIDEKAGRFYVIPKSIDVNLHSEIPDLPWIEWMKRIKKYADENQNKIQAPDLRKGDVLFWNSRTIHGSLPTIDPAYSRKSLTAHYLPSEYKFGNLFVTKDFIKYKTSHGMNFYRNQPDYSLLNKLKSGIKVSVYSSPRLLKFLRKIQSMVMNK